VAKYYAEIINNIVNQVLVMDEGWSDQECKDWLNTKVSTNEWLETKMDGSMRNQYAGKGYEYHQDIDSFVSKKPYDSWTLNKDKKRYEAPTPRPDDDKSYEWDERDKQWKEIPDIKGEDNGE
jgi:hypothetical protein